MADTIAIIQAMLLEQVEPKIQDQIDWHDVLLEDVLNVNGTNRVGVEVDQKNNKLEIVSLKNGMTAYAGAEQGALIDSSIGLERMELVPKFVKSRFVLGHEQINTASKSGSSLKSVSELYGMEIRRSMLRAKGRYLRGDGTGIVGILPAGVQTGTTVTVSVKAPGTTVSGNRYGLGALQVFDKAQKIRIGTEAAFAAGTATLAVISDVLSDSSITLTASATVGSAAGANNRAGTNEDTWYVRFEGEYGVAPMGLLGLVDDGTLSGVSSLQGLTRASTPYMKSVVYDKANASTIIKDFRDLYTAVTKFNKNVKYFVVSEDVYAKYTDSISITVQAQQSSASYTSKLGTGHTGLAFAYGSQPLPILQDQLLPYGTVLLLDPDMLFAGDLFADQFVDGAVMARITGTTNYETIRAAYYNYGTYGCRKLGGRIQYQSV
jgi:hypothetical protein